MVSENRSPEGGVARTEKLTLLLLVGLLTVQTGLLGLLVVRVNGLQKLLLGTAPGVGFGTGGGAEVLDVDPGDGPGLGAPEAAVTIVEFSCFTCPACADIQPELKRTLARHPGRVRLAFRYFPLRLEGKPILLATAAECARRQDRFWEAHDLLFQASTEIEGEPDLLAALAPLGLDLASLTDCLAAKEAEARVRADFEAGRSYGVNSTPTLFVNGRRVQGADFASLSRLVEASLAER